MFCIFGEPQFCRRLLTATRMRNEAACRVPCRIACRGICADWHELVPYVEWLTKQLSGMADFYKGEDRPGIT